MFNLSFILPALILALIALAVMSKHNKKNNVTAQADLKRAEYERRLQHLAALRTCQTEIIANRVIETLSLEELKKRQLDLNELINSLEAHCSVERLAAVRASVEAVEAQISRMEPIVRRADLLVESVEAVMLPAVQALRTAHAELSLFVSEERLRELRNNLDSLALQT